MRRSAATADASDQRYVTRARYKLAGALLLGLLLAGSAGAASDGAADAYDQLESSRSTYDPLEAGHPLRIAAYVLHPVGVILDRLILRPAYWLGSHEPIKTLVGRTDY